MGRFTRYCAAGLAVVVSFTTSVAVGADTDMDGVDDRLDVCCNTPRGVPVDTQGRPVDDRNGDCSVDLGDLMLFVRDLMDPAGQLVDLLDFAAFQNGFTGELLGGASCCNAALNPMDDGSGQPLGGVPDLIFSEIKPGEFIELFNTTSGDIDLSTAPYAAYQYCSPFEYSLLPANMVVPALGYATLPWPSDLAGPFNNATNSSGEFILYKDFFFTSSTSVLDFVCWGSPPQIPAGTRKPLVQTAGKWATLGTCAPAIPAGGSIHRKPGTTGTSAASYDVTAPSSPQDCTP